MTEENAHAIFWMFPDNVLDNFLNYILNYMFVLFDLAASHQVSNHTGAITTFRTFQCLVFIKWLLCVAGRKNMCASHVGMTMWWHNLTCRLCVVAINFIPNLNLLVLHLMNMTKKRNLWDVKYLDLTLMPVPLMHKV